MIAMYSYRKLHLDIRLHVLHIWQEAYLCFNENYNPSDVSEVFKKSIKNSFFAVPVKICKL